MNKYDIKTIYEMRYPEIRSEKGQEFSLSTEVDLQEEGLFWGDFLRIIRTSFIFNFGSSRKENFYPLLRSQKEDMYAFDIFGREWSPSDYKNFNENLDKCRSMQDIQDALKFKGKVQIDFVYNSDIVNIKVNRILVD